MQDWASQEAEFPKMENSRTHTCGMKANRLRRLFGLSAILLQVVALQSFAQQANEQEEQAQAGQCLNVQVLDPLSEPMEAAMVTIEDQEQRTNDSGLATFCDLGPGPHGVIVSAEGFQVHESSVPQAEGTVTITMQLLIQTEELVVVGSRAEARSVTESTVPVDVITGEEFARQGVTDVSDLMRTLTPSFNVNTQPISDAATIVRPANLRSLPPDHTLVLVNGKRRHRAAVIQWLGNGVADGAQGPDISVIPAIALKQVEVLRDGASAQYGSDAIAGVMNFQLKDARSGGSVEVRTGGYLDGNYGDSRLYPDAGGHGVSYSFAGNTGLPLGANGFANLSVEYGNANPTNRSVQRDDAKALIAAGNTYVRDPAQVWGSPRIEDDVKMFGNFGHLLDNGMELYGHTNYASKKVTGGFYFRNPATRGGVFASVDRNGDGYLLIGDALQARGVGSANCPRVAVTSGVVSDQAALEQVFADPNCFSIQELQGRFRGGFTPQFGGDVEDMSAVAGLRGLINNNLLWDTSISVGSNDVGFFINNTVNASLGPESPTQFNPGSYAQTEVNANFDLSYAASDMINLAGGAEWRNEQFKIGAGDRASWEIGPYAAQGFSSGSNGFNGFRADVAAGKWDRSNVAIYGDVEVSGQDDAWSVGAAARVEDFEDFGATMNSKLSGRFELVHNVALRAGVSSGFRAPTPGQQNAFNVTTEFNFDIGDLINLGVIPSTNPVARLRGGEPLQPEASINYSVGMIVDAGPFTFTADYFRIDVSDRIALTQDFSLTATEVEDLLAAGVREATNLAEFRFFVNDFSTKTEGVDLVSTFTPLALGGNTTFSFVFNHTKTKVTTYSPETINDLRINELERGLPETRWNFSVNHRARRWNLLGRLNYFGSYWDSEDAQVALGSAMAPLYDPYSGKVLLDLELGFPFGDSVTLAVGGQNVLNTYPDENPFAAAGIGNRYGQFSPFGFNGAYYYARLSYSFGASFK